MSNLMTTLHATCSFLEIDPVAWSADWAWGLPLIVLTVIFHVTGLGYIRERVVHGEVGRRFEHSHPKLAFVIVVGTSTLLASCLHGIEAGIWAAAYRFLGTLPNPRSSMLYSLNALTSYGHTSLDLPEHWHLLGALEALNGWLLFGLSTAFLFAVIEKVWSVDEKPEHR
jgi:hypothetical protein